jgi:hypothetical protein
MWKSIKLKSLALTFVSICLAAVSGAKTVEAATLKVVASGLDNPRRITFGPDGALYIAEAGTGGSAPLITGPELNVLLGFGSTGAVTRVQNGIQHRLVSGLPSLALTPPGTTPPQTVGSFSAAVGPHDIGFGQNGDAYILLGYASTANQKNILGSAGVDLGRLLSFNVNADRSWIRKNFSIDLLAHRELYNPYASGDYLNNPYDLEVQGNKFVIADPGGNNFFTADIAGNVSLGARFAPRVINGVSVESVPTSITIGPDGAYYIGELTGAPYPEGSARVYRVIPGNEPEIYADGFTQITGLDFDDKGNLYVLEYSVNSLIDPTAELIGALIQVSPDGVRRTVVGAGEGLVAPNGLTIGPDGAIYVSNFTTTVGTGQVVRIDPRVSVLEPNNALGVLVIGAIGVGSLLRRSLEIAHGKAAYQDLRKSYVCR